MKKVIQAEKNDPSFELFESTDFDPLTKKSETLPTTDPTFRETRILDNLVSLIKFVFLYIPGAAAIHMIMLGFALSFYYEQWSNEILAGTAGVSLVSAFMIMLGVGKLGDLKYLRVVGAVALAGAIFAVLYSILITLIPGDFFGMFARFSLPLTLLAGYLVKRDTDRISKQLFDDLAVAG